MTLERKVHDNNLTFEIETYSDFKTNFTKASQQDQANAKNREKSIIFETNLAT